jgi:bla regulator protein blaR1
MRNVLIVLLSVAAYGISPPRYAALSPQLDGPTRFEVASVKSNPSGTTAVQWRWQQGRLTAVNVTANTLISTAYGSPQQPLADWQMSGGPGWLQADRFDVLAVEPAGVPGGSPAGASTAGLLMLRSLLEDRFKLKVHFESKELRVYALVLSKPGSLGPRLRQRTATCEAVAAKLAAGEPCRGHVFPGTLLARGITMTQFVSGLARLMPDVGRSVIDRTGLAGSFDVDLTWTPDRTPMPMPVPPGGDGTVTIPPVDPNGPSLFTALQEQLGLRLDSSRGPVQVLVVDQVAKPTED